MKEWLIFLQVPVVYIAPAIMYGTWRVLKARRFWISLVGSLIFGGMVMLLIATGPKEGDLPTPTVVALIGAAVAAGACWIYGCIFLNRISVRMTRLLARVEAADDHDGLIVFHERKGLRRPEEDLRDLLPLIEAYGPVRGHENINLEWIGARLQRAERIAPQVDQLLVKARELPSPKRRWWVPSDV